MVKYLNTHERQFPSQDNIFNKSITILINITVLAITKIGVMSRRKSQSRSRFKSRGLLDEVNMMPVIISTNQSGKVIRHFLSLSNMDNVVLTH